MQLLVGLELITTLLLAQPAVLSDASLTIPLVQREDALLSNRLAEVVRSPSQNVVLLLEGVNAESNPEASWEVYVGPASAQSDSASPYFVGVVSLFDRGIISGERGSVPAEFIFVLDRAIAASGMEELTVKFVPVATVVVDGRPQEIEVRSAVTISQISLAVDEVKQR